jgi:PAS domain S-box-containing protein
MIDRTRLTFRAKLMAVVGISTLGFLLLVVASEVISKRLDRQLATIQTQYLPKLVLEPELGSAFDRLRRGFQDAVAAHDAEALASTRSEMTTLLGRLADAGGAIAPEDRASLRAALEDYFAAALDVSRRLIADEAGEAVVEAMAAMQAKQARVERALEQATSFDRRALTEAFAGAEHSNVDARRYRLWIICATVAIVASLSIGLSRSLLESVSQLAAGFERFGAGRFGEPIRIASGDEWGDLADHANQMALRLERAAAERQRAEDKFRTLLEAAPDAIVIVNDGRISLVNAQTEQLFGYSRSELIGQGAEILLAERYRQEPLAASGQARDPLSAHSQSPSDLFGVRKDGTEFPVEIRSSPLETDEGLLVSSAIRDVTDRKHIEAELKASNAELEAFSYSVAHDLRAPLRGINGFSRVLLEDAGDKLDDECKDYLRRIGAGSERMSVLIDALLSLSRVTRVEVQREAVDMTRAAEAVMGQLRASQPERVVEFQNQPNVVAHGDPSLIRAVFDNLLGNAWKFTGGRPEGCITFGAERRGAAMVYFIKDNGAGFDMTFADKLFAPFQRLHTVREFAGTGIGLATVQRIVRRHGGEIWAEAAVDRGATFYFTLATSVGGRPS